MAADDNDAPAESGDAEASEESQPGTGLECSPAVSEVETRRPIPISCAVTRNDVKRVEARYRAPGKKKFTRLRLKKIGDEWVGEIPCTATTKRGAFKLSFSGRDKQDKPATRVATTIELVDATNEAPPSLPGREPPMRCYDAKECPPEFRGSAACPGTKATSGARAWGASCVLAKDCQKGLACISGTCETPPKCESDSECESNDCSGGVCQILDPADMADRLDSPKHNWIGLHFGVDLALTPKGADICSPDSEDGKKFDCFRGSNAYTGVPNRFAENDASSGFRLGTMRALISYERWFGRVSAGVRAGFAFGGAPKDFRPVHLEARVQYALRKDVLSKHGRPYLGLAAGLAQVDVKSKTLVADCVNPNDTACAEAQPTPNGLPIPNDSFRELPLDVYRRGSKAFFGPTLGYIYAFSNDSALSFNVNVMFPDIVFEPAVGYVLGL